MICTAIVVLIPACGISALGLKINLEVAIEVNTELQALLAGPACGAPLDRRLGVFGCLFPLFGDIDDWCSRALTNPHY